MIDRFKQIEPKILIVSDYYYYNQKKIYTTNIVPKILHNITSIEKYPLEQNLHNQLNYHSFFPNHLFSSEFLLLLPDL